MENKQSDKLLIAKIEDKIRISKTQNKITNSEFLNEYQIANIEKELVKLKQKEYFFFGGYREDVSKIESKAIEFETINISVNSLRLDNIISEILKTSRKIAQEQIEQEKVFINYTAETKSTKNLKENDILVIRGKGKYIIEKFLGKNKKRKGNNTNKKIRIIYN